MTTDQKDGSPEERTKFWKEQVVAFNQSGLTLQDFCHERRIGYSTLCSWRRRLSPHRVKRRRGAPSVDKVAIPVLAGAQSDSVELRVGVGGLSLEFASTARPEWVAALLLALYAGRSGQC